MATSVNTQDIIGASTLDTWDYSTPAKFEDGYIVAVVNITPYLSWIAVSDYPLPYTESTIRAVASNIPIDLVSPST